MKNNSIINIKAFSLPNRKNNSTFEVLKRYVY